MNRFFAILAALSLALPVAACRITGQLPYYRETNERRPASAMPYEVRREQPYPRVLIDASLRERSAIARSKDMVFGVASALLPADVAKENRDKLERAIGRPIRRGEDATHPIHADPFPDVDVILAVSGGGHRAANLGGAVLFELSRAELVAPSGRRVSLLDTVDTISSVSGGGFASAFYVFHRSVFRGNADPGKARRHEELIHAGLRENIQARLLSAIVYPAKISFFIRGATRATRTNLYSNLIEYRFIRPQRIESLEAAVYPSWWKERKIIYTASSIIKNLLWFISPVTPDDQYMLGVSASTYDDLFLRDPDNPSVLYPLRPEWFVNGTAYSAPVDENQFLFDEVTFNRFESNWMDYRISDAVAASAAFPVVFSPLGVRDYAGEEATWQFVFDGGVSDNQGMNGVRRALARKPASHRAIVIMVDASPRTAITPAGNAARPGGMAITNRALERYMDQVRQDAIDELRALERAGGVRFFHLSIRPDEFGAPLTEEARAVLDAANDVPTALKISREDQDTLFAAGRSLVGRDREAMISALRDGAAGGLRHLPEEAGTGEKPLAPDP